MQVGAETLSPRQRITSAAFSIVSENSRLLNGSDSSAFASATHSHAGGDISSGTVADARIDAAIARDSEIVPTVLASDGTGSTLDADLLDGTDSSGFAAATHSHGGADIASGTVADVRIDAAIARDSEIVPTVLANDGVGSGLDADTVDGVQGADLEESAEIDADITAHAGVADAHHARYTDSEAVSAMGTKSDTNPLHHDKTTTLPWGSITSIPAGFADGIDNDSGAAFWSLTGNSGTGSRINFLGTTDNVALQLHVNNARALRLEPNATSPNLIGGYSGNSATAGAYGAAIGGGGAGAWLNTVTDSYGTVGGGANNRAGDDTGTTWDARFASVGGGLQNTASGFDATVGGGEQNTASGGCATVAGGLQNMASGPSATVSGGVANTVIGEAATVGGGYYNQANADFATIAGGGPSDIGDPTNTDNRVFDNYGTIGGGGYNRAGSDDADPQSAYNATVGGGSGNTASGENATVSGGYSNSASDSFATVGGGEWNEATGHHGTIGGGGQNYAIGLYSTVGGGGLNSAGGDFATVAGGYFNYTEAMYATTGGGWNNTASGLYAAVPGGSSNEAKGDYSFAAGRRAIADGAGSFVWGDSNNFDLHAWGADQFVVRATGGYWLFSGVDASGTPTSGVTLAAGSGTWGSWCDRNSKANFVPVHPRAVLEKVAALPISTWNYIAQDPSIRHMGPMAQDLYAAFGLGEDDKHIGTIDADGVALAAIQGLHEIVQEKDTELSTLRKQNAQLQERLSALETLVENLAEKVGGQE